MKRWQLLFVCLCGLLCWSTAFALDPNDLPPYGDPPPPDKAGDKTPSSETDVDNGDGTWTFIQQVDEYSTSPHYTGPWVNVRGTYGFQYYSWYNQDYGWQHNFPHWNTPGLNVLSATMTVHAWDIDSEPEHGYDGEYDGVHVDGTLLSPGYLQGTNNTWSTTVFDLPLSSITDDGYLNAFLDIDMHHTTYVWATTIDYSQIEIVYSMFENDPPFQPELSYNLTLISDCFGGADCAAIGQDLVISIDGPIPPDPDGDAVTYQYRWFVDVGTGGFIDDEFAGRGDHTGNTVPSADILPGDIWQVQVTPTDEHGAVGNFASVTFTPFCPDQTGCNDPPIAICQDITLDADVDCEANGSIDNGSYDPNGDPTTITYIPSGPYPLGITVVTLRITDSGGLWDECNGTVTVVDNTPPVATCSGDMTVGNDAGSCDAAVTFVSSFTDNCPGGSIVCVPPSGSIFPLGVTTVTCTATDAAGNTDVCTFDITVNDTEDPVATCSGDMTVDNDPGSCDAAVTYVSSFTDNCPGGNIACVPASGSTFPLGVTTVTCTATDAAGNTDVCTFDITVNDTENPVATCSGDMTVGNDAGSCDAAVTFTSSFTDNCPGGSIACVPPSGSTFPLGVTTVTCTATDAAGNTDVCSFDITVNDTENPVATCSGDMTVGNDAGSCDAAVTFVSSFTDNCPGGSIVCVPPSGSIFPLGVTTVTCTATDAAGNTDVCSFDITVNDTEDPVATCPGDINVGNDPGSCDAVVTFTSSFTDNCPGGNIACVPPSGSIFPLGVTTVTCTATDAAGNTDVCTFDITVNDTENPVATCPGDMTLPNDLGSCDAVVMFASSFTDNCPGGSIACVPPSGSTFPLGVTTVACTATDAAGNTDVCTFDITVNDTENPVATCAGDVTVGNDAGSCDAAVTFTSSFTDNCPGGSIACVPPSGSTFPLGVTTVTCTATDAAGNTDVCSFDITVNDLEDPVFDQPCPGDITVECDAVPAPETPTASDNCDPDPGVAFVEVNTPGACVQAYTLTRTWTATDMSGNSAECVQVITVEDNTPPVFDPIFSQDCNDTTYWPCDVIIDPAPAESIPVSDNCDPDPVVTFQEIERPGACPQEYSLEWIFTATDACGNFTECHLWNVFVDTLAPVLTVPQDQAYFFCEAQEISLSVICNDNCDFDPALAVVDGPGEITGGVWRYTPSGDEISVVTVRAEDACGNSSEDSFTVSFDFNSPPVLTCPVDAMVDWGSLYQGQAVVVDTDTMSGQSTIVYTRTGGPASVNVNSSTGAVIWTPSATEMVVACQYTIEITATDSCGASDVCSYVVSLWNDTPEIVCSDEVINMFWGYATGGSVTATDDDGGPAPLTYYLASFAGPGFVYVDPGTGDWTWQTEEDVAYLGDFELCIGVTDSAAIGCSPPTNPNNADTCCVMIHVVPTADIVIEKTHDAYQGQYELVSVTIENSPLEMGGFDFLIAYDASALNFTGAEPGQLLEDCGWEYFTYRYGAEGNCGDACPSGLLRIIAIAETNNGPNHPLCYGPPDADPYELFQLRFLVTDDRTFECQYAPVYFFWDDCGDNTISSVSGDSLYVDRTIYDFEENLIWWEEDDDEFPEDERIPYVGAPDYCLNPDPDKPTAMRIIDFTNGGVDIVCADSIDARGDINLNGQSNEIADATLFCNYFISGLGVFTVNTEGQIAASDVNADGIVLSVADLVYLIRVVVGDALPLAKPGPAIPVDCRIHSDGTLSIADKTAMGAAALVVQGNVTPRLLAENMQVIYSSDGLQTHILVYSLAGSSFTGDFLQVDGELVSIEMATALGNPVHSKLVPSEFRLWQNYPNPFNPTTTIGFSLSEATDYRLTIYNVVGQVVAEFSDYASAGHHIVEWNSAGEASGVYFYRLTAGQFTDTKKMIMLK